MSTVLHKTRVFRVAPGRWRVSYYLPYTGVAYGDSPTWEAAFRDAIWVEKQREWL